MISGIYRITNLINHKSYIGQSINIKDRWKDHRYQLRANKHHAPYLQRAWNKYGEHNFEFEVLYECLPIKEDLSFREQWFVNLYGDYNTAQATESQLGSKRTPEQIDKFRRVQSCTSVIHIDLEGNILGEYYSMSEAARQLGLLSSVVSRSIKKYSRVDNKTMFVKSVNDIELALRKSNEKLERRKEIMKEVSRKNGMLTGKTNGAKNGLHCIEVLGIPVQQIDKDTGEVIATYRSCREAAKTINIHNSQISYCISGKRGFRTAGGYKWRAFDTKHDEAQNAMGKKVGELVEE